MTTREYEAELHCVKSPLRALWGGEVFSLETKVALLAAMNQISVLMLVKDKYTETNTKIHNWPAPCEELGEEPSGTVKYFL